MAQDLPLIHALKATKRTGKVKVLSVAFLETAHVNDFKDRLRSALARSVRKYGRFTIRHKEGRNDWFIEFANSWPESELDDHLKNVAIEMGTNIYLEPGVPLAEFDPLDLRSFLFRPRS